MKDRSATVELVLPSKVGKRVLLPLALEKISAGFPSPADDHIERALDLNEHLVIHPEATFFVRVSGESMMGAGILPEDILVVDRSLEVANNKVIIARLGTELLVKRIKKVGQQMYLCPENEKFQPVLITPEMDFEVWGVVTHAIHKL